MLDPVKTVLDNPDYCPCLLLGKLAVEFKRQYKGKIFLVGNLEAVRGVVNEYSGISDLEGRYCVLDGVGFLSDIGQNSLLKFIEESKFPVILLSYYDKVSPIIMSRMKFVFKAPIMEVDNLKFMRAEDCFNALDEKSKQEELTMDDRVKYFAENCPLAYYIENSGNYDSGSRRINKLLGKL